MTMVDTMGTYVISQDIILHNMLQVPTFNVNLLSVSQLIAKSKYTINFLPNSFCIQDPQGTSIGMGRHIDGLYIP